MDKPDGQVSTKPTSDQFDFLPSTFPRVPNQTHVREPDTSLPTGCLTLIQTVVSEPDPVLAVLVCLTLILCAAPCCQLCP